MPETGHWRSPVPGTFRAGARRTKAALIYSYWRPELRYKVVDIGHEQLRKVQKAAKWLLDKQRQM